MRPTLKDVAERAGVNFTLVSKYLNASPQARMTAETKARIEHALAELDYHPSAAARALKSGRTKTLGLLVGNLTNAYNAHYADFAMRCCAGYGFQLLLGLHDGMERSRKAALDNLTSRGVDAVFSSTGEIFSSSGKSLETSSSPDFSGAWEKAFSFLGTPKGKSVYRIVFEDSSAMRKQKIPYLRTLRASFDEETRLGELRELCSKKPETILTGGWQTAMLLEELLEKEFPLLHPNLIPAANCCGSFLSSPHIAGVFYYSQKEQILSVVLKALSSAGEKLSPPPVQKAVFLTRKEYLEKGLAEGRFRLT